MAGINCKRLTFKGFLSGVCACLNVALSITMLISLNALFNDWMNSFRAGRGSTTSVQATSVGLAYGAGLVAGMLERKLGERVSLLLGTALASTGFQAGGFVTSLPALIVCVGVVTGSGCCLIYLSTVSTVLRKFPDRAAFLSSALTCSASLMSLGTPLFFRYLSEQYTWRGCLVLAGGILLHTAIFSLLLTSPLLHSTPAKPPPISASLGDYELVARDPCSDVADDMAAQAHHSSELSAVDINNDGDSNTKSVFQTESSEADSNPCAVADDEREVLECKADYLPAQERELISLPATKTKGEDKNASSVFSSKEYSDTNKKHAQDDGCFSRFRSSAAFVKDPLYICVTLCTVVSFSTSISFVFLVLDFATHKGWSVQDGIFFNFLFQLLGLLSRVLVGVVSLHRRVRSVALLIVSALISGTAVCLVGQVSSFLLASVLFSFMGIGYGGLAGMFPAAALEVIGPGPTYPVALGLLCTLGGSLNAAAGSVGGLLVDVLQSYSILSFIYGPLALTVTLLLLYVYLCHGRPRRSPDMAS